MPILQARHHRLIFLAILLSLLTGCAGTGAPLASPSTGTSSQGAEVPRSSAPKRITVAIRGDPKALSAKLNSAAGAGGIPGVGEMEELINAGFANEDTPGALHVQLAEAIPTVENGLWKVNPDGTMETTWKIRPGVKWHDGTPFTSADVAFTARVEQDPELPIFRNVAYSLISAVETPDDSTVTVRWKQTFIDADRMFTNSRSMPMPRHLLEKTFVDDKESFLNSAYWREGFVGTGPFRLREFTPGSRAVLEANPDYVLGRPKIDTIEVRFIPDPNTIAANILSGEVDLTLGGRLSLEWAVQVRDQWQAGRMATGGATSAVSFYPQFINPSPAIQANVQFRRGLLHAIDRQQIVDELSAGIAPIAHTTLGPSHADWAAVEPSVVKYEYNPRRAEELFAGLGLTKGPDGMLRETSGQRISIETRSTANDDSQVKSMFITADFWQRVGIASEQVLVPSQRTQDREYRATRPAFEIVRQPGGPKELERIYGKNTPLPENSFTGVNRSRYQSAELDGLIDRYRSTIPLNERVELMKQIARHVSDQLVVIGMFWDPTPTMVSNRLKNVTSPGDTWDSQGWDVS